MLAAGGGTERPVFVVAAGDGVGVGVGVGVGGGLGADDTGATMPPFGVGAASGIGSAAAASAGRLVTVSAVSQLLSEGRSFSLFGSDGATSGLDGIFPRIGPGPICGGFGDPTTLGFGVAARLGFGAFKGPGRAGTGGLRGSLTAPASPILAHDATGRNGLLALDTR